MSHIYSVTELNQQIKGLLESNPSFGNIFVQGEISNYKLHTSGHHYLTLKDEKGAIPAVLFRSDAMRLRFHLQNGLRVIARGRVSSFPKTGQVQLYLADLMPDGTGGLHLAFEQLKQRLDAEGLFDCAHKKALPAFPKMIALVTSPTGAAVRDMLRILQRRYPLAMIQIWPVLVQGDQAPSDIVRAIAQINLQAQVDLMIVGRGGGSLEDLWAFNEEMVARAIYASNIPVICAVGHQPDVTISDYIADVSAPTPSAAAELAVPDQNELRMSIDRAQERLMRAMRRQLKWYHTHVAMLTQRIEHQQPILTDKRQLIDQLEVRLHHSIRHRIKQAQSTLSHNEQRMLYAYKYLLEQRRGRLIACADCLDALSPFRVLSRGFSVITNSDGDIITHSKRLRVGDCIRVRLAHGVVHATVKNVEE